MKKYNFCTLFDKNYLYKGLALYNSLLKVCDNFKLWILCFDNETYNLLKKIRLENTELISLRDFEDEELLKIKNTRTPAEYCWTCTSSLLLYLFKKKPTLDFMTYLDADLFFYSDPSAIYQELGEDSILITSHNYSKRYERYEKIHGKYNVQFIVFRNDSNAMECLNWWRNKCIEWCYIRYENNKWGDQKYLDDWTERFRGVHVLKRKGAGVAPWNIQKYSIKSIDNKIYIDDQKLIFYHFHQLNILSPTKFDLTRGYALSKNTIEFIYKPYLYQINTAINFVSKEEPGFNYGYDIEYLLRPSSIKTAMKSIIFRHKILKNIIRTYIARFIGKHYYLYELKN